MLFFIDNSYANVLFSTSSTNSVFDNMVSYAANTVNPTNKALILTPATTMTRDVNAAKARLEALGYTVTISATPSSYGTISSLQQFDIVINAHNVNSNVAFDNASFCTALDGYVASGGGLILNGLVSWAAGQGANYKNVLQAISPFSTISNYSVLTSYNLTYVEPTHPILANVPVVSIPTTNYATPLNAGYVLRSGATVVATFSAYQPYSASSNSPVCSGSSLNLTATGGTAYSWSGPNGFTSTQQNPTITNATTANAGTYSCVITLSGGGTTTLSVAVVVNNAPAVTTQPTSVTTAPSSNTTFSVTATGTNLNYQWQVNTGSGFANVSNASPYSGATTSTLSISGATLGMNGYEYKCIVSNGGCTSATSSTATLSVNNCTVLSAGTLSGTQEICTTGTTTFTSTASPVQLDRGLSFVGGADASSSDYVTVNSSFPVSSGDFTIEVWVKPTIIDNSYRGFFGSQAQLTQTTSNRDQSMWVGPNGSLHTDYFTGGVRYDMLTSNNFFSADTWTHVAWVKEGTTFKLYKNGVFVTSRTAPANAPAVNGFYWLGRVDNFFSGSLDEFRIWNVARSENQIQLNMNKEVAAQTNLVAYYNFNQGTAAGTNTGLTTLTDGSGSSLNGTLTGFTLSGATSNWVVGATVGGTWTSSDASIATVHPLTGVITGINAGTATITYTLEATGSCTDPTATRTVTVSANPDPATIIGTQTVCAGGTTQFTATGSNAVAANGTSLHFDGVDDYASVPDNNTLDIANAITVEAWVYPTKNSGIQNVLSKSSTGPNNSYIFPRTDDGWQNFVGYLSLNGGWQTISYAYPSLNTWHHLALTYDGSIIKLYLDGVLVNSRAATGTIDANTNVLALGNQTGFGEFYGGRVDELRLWNVARTQAQIAASKDVEIAAQANLIAYYKFNEGVPSGTNTSITTLLDASSNGFNATMQNFAKTGATSNWVGSTQSLSGTWTSSNNAVATVSSSGLVSGVAAGTATITFVLPGSPCADVSSVRTVTVTAPPSAGELSGTQAICVGGSTTFTSTVTGGTWSSSNTAVATVNATTGVVTGLAAGTATITYTKSSTGCSDATVTRTVTVTAAPNPGILSGTQAICIAGTTQLATNGASGGTWTSGTTGVATVSTTGLVTGVAAGTSTISYTVAGTGGCADATATRVVTVTAPPSSGTLSGAQTAFIGGTTTFASTVTGGSWSSSNTAVASVNTSTGVVTGVAAGTATITYTVTGTGGCADASATRTVTVYACPTIPAMSASAYPVCAESNFTLTAAGLSGMSSLSSGIIFKYSTTALANPYVGGTVIATIPFASLEASSTVARTTTSMATGGTYYIYAILSSTPGGTGCLPYATTTLVVNPKGQVTVPSDIVVCHGTSVAAQTLSTTNSGGTTTYAWTNSATSIGLAASGSTATIPAFTATNTGATAVTATIAVTPTYIAGGLSCPGPVTSYTVTVNPVPVLSSVANQVICAGSTGAVNFNSTAPGTTAQSLTVSSGAISLAIPDASATGVSSALAVTVPTGATISGISVNFNITHTWDSDLTINLVAPNGQVLNLVRSRGGSANNFTNTTISSASTTSLSTGSAPFTGTFAADAVTGVGPTAYTSTAANFAALYTGITSGNWRLAVRDGGSGDVGTIDSWSITINYNPPPSINWTNSNTAIGLAASGVGNINFTATNPGPNQITSNLTATPFYTNGGLTCTGTPINFTIAVNPVGQVNAVNNQVLCNGSATSAVTFVTTNNGLISSGGTQTASSGTISVSIPDASTTGVTNVIPVTLPTGAVISNVRVTLNMTHTWISDMVINLKAPNGQILNLFEEHGGSGDNLVNTVVSSTGTTSFASGSAPFTGTFAATAAIGVGPTGNVSTAANFAALYSTPNGNWTLSLQDLYLGDLGTLTGWSISFDYAVQGAFGTNMNWTNSATSIGLGASGTGHIPSFTATNTGATPVTSTVTVTPVYFNGGTSCAGTPITYTYTVNPTPTVNTVATQTFCAGTPATVSHTGAVTNTVYSWTNSNTAIGLAASGTGNISFTPTNTGTTPITATITVTPSYTNAGVTCTGTPKTYTIMVNPVGQVNAVTSQVLCNGSATTAVTFATVNGGGTVIPGTPITASSGAITVAIPDNNAAGVAHTIPVTLPASSVVTKVTANFNITHTWDSDLSINLVAPNGQVLNLVNRRGGSGDNFTNTTISPTATTAIASGSAPFTGTFLPDAAIGAGSTSFASTAANFAALYSVGSGDWKLVLRDHAGGDVGTLTGWSLTFEYGALIPAVTSYAWTNNTPSIGLAATGTGNIASFTATNTTAAPVTSTVTVTPTYTNNGVGCAGTPITYTYTVNPTPTVNVVANQTVCRGSNVAAIAFSGATTGTVYTWTNSNTAVGLAASGTGDIASFVGTNTTAAPITATITVTPRYTNAGVTCVGTPRTFTITVNPIPTVNAVTSFPVCHNSPVAVPFSGATTGTVYSWTNTNPAIGLAASGTGNLSFTATNPNTGGAPITATITVTPSYTNNGVTCVGTPTSFTITVNPLPVVSAGTLPSRICISDTLVKLNGTPVGGSWSGIGTSGTNFIPTATNIGSYALTYTYADINGCVNRATITANVLACEERNRDLDNEAVILYPNPNSGQFNLRINSTRFNVLGMKVYNTAGQLVSVKQWGGLVYARVIPVNLTNLAAGIYVVRLYYGDGMDRGADKSYQIIIAR